MTSQEYPFTERLVDEREQEGNIQEASVKLLTPKPMMELGCTRQPMLSLFSQTSFFNLLECKEFRESANAKPAN